MKPKIWKQIQKQLGSEKSANQMHVEKDSELRRKLSSLYILSLR